jgi:hypothetical protein
MPMRLTYATALAAASQRFVQLLRERPGLLSLVAILSGTYITVRYLMSPWRRLPPGPIGYPFIGSALSLFDKRWLFTKCKTYGR